MFWETVKSTCMPRAMYFVFSLGHWMWCLQYEDPLDTKTCANNADSTGPPAYGNSKCKGFWWASRVCVLNTSLLSDYKCCVYTMKHAVWAPPQPQFRRVDKVHRQKSQLLCRNVYQAPKVCIVCIPFSRVDQMCVTQRF